MNKAPCESASWLAISIGGENARTEVALPGHARQASGCDDSRDSCMAATYNSHPALSTQKGIHPADGTIETVMPAEKRGRLVFMGGDIYLYNGETGTAGTSLRRIGNVFE